MSRPWLHAAVLILLEAVVASAQPWPRGKLDSIAVTLSAAPCEHRICLSKRYVATRAFNPTGFDSLERRAIDAGFASLPGDIASDGGLCASRTPAKGTALTQFFWGQASMSILDANACEPTDSARARLASLREFRPIVRRYAR